MKYTIKKVADLAGITVRTLQYYDKFGLLNPTINSSNKYRLYGEEDVMRLQQILFFRELEFSLKQIKKMMNSPAFDSHKVLVEQRELLRIKRERLDEILNTIDSVIDSKRRGEDMSDDQLLGSFSKQQIEEFKNEARRRWGDTDLWRQSQERTSGMTVKEFKDIAMEIEGWTQELAMLRDTGNLHDSIAIQQMIAKHYESLKTFYEPNLEMYSGLAHMYVDDHRFMSFYERFGDGLAIFLRDAMLVFIKQQER